MYDPKKLYQDIEDFIEANKEFGVIAGTVHADIGEATYVLEDGTAWRMKNIHTYARETSVEWSPRWTHDGPFRVDLLEGAAYFGRADDGAYDLMDAPESKLNPRLGIPYLPMDRKLEFGVTGWLTGPTGAYVHRILISAIEEAIRAAAKYPQPNRNALKLAEEAGEVIKAAVHYSEKRGEWAEVEKEAIQTIAMVLRVLCEGDQPNNIIPPITRELR